MIAVSHHPYFSRPVNPRQAAARRHRPRARTPAIPGPAVDWVLVDRRVSILDPQFPNVLRSFASAAEDGREVRLFLACPPALSLGLLLDGSGPIRPGWRKPTVLAAHGGRLLLRVPAPPEVDLLMFTADEVSSLVSIPRRPDINVANLSMSRGTGFISDGDDYFVAFLETRITWSGNTQSEIATVSVFSSRSGRWSALTIDMPFLQPPTGVEWSHWRLDAAVSYTNCITWADFSRGLITCTVFEDQPNLYFMALPVLSERSPVSWTLNTLCVTADNLNFLHITRGPAQHQATVSVWRLDRLGYCWTDDGGLILNCGARLPRSPLLSGQDPHIMHLLLNQGDVKFVYALDWHEAEFVARYPYVEDVSRGAAFDTPYVGSDVSRYVINPPAFPFGPSDGDGDLGLQRVQPRIGVFTKAQKND